MVLGPQVLGKVSPIYLNYSPAIKQWAGVLSAIVFSCSFLGLKLEKVTGSALQTYFLAGSIHQAQVIIGLSLTFLVMLVVGGDLKFDDYYSVYYENPEEAPETIDLRKTTVTDETIDDIIKNYVNVERKMDEQCRALLKIKIN